MMFAEHFKIFQLRFDKTLKNLGHFKKNCMKKILLMSCCWVLAFSLQAQQRTVTGKVTDQDDGTPLPGVSVLVKGTSRGAVTDANGTFSIEAAPEDVLTLSFIGFEPQDVTVGDRTAITVPMVSSISELQEVVVIGYGERERKDITGAISSITAKEITKEVKMTPELAMQGKMAGVFISNPGSDPTARPTIRIRGVSSLGFNDPLYVIDGIPITEGGAGSSVPRVQDLRGTVNIMNMINPNDIESISVLKDATATAIYGVRASNGVILIQTKRGKEGRARINFSANYGVQNISKRYDVLNTADYVALANEGWDNNTVDDRDDDAWGTLFDPTSVDYLGNSPTYDWMDEASVKNAAIQDYNISISGGSEKSTYALGAGFANQQNAMYRSEFDRYSFFLNSDHKLTDWLKMGESFRLVYSETDASGGPSVQDASLVNPWQPLFDVNGPNGYAVPRRVVNGTSNPKGYGNSTRNNFLGQDDKQTSIRTLLRNLGSFYAEISPLKGLRFRGTVSIDYYTNTNEGFTLPEAGLFDAQSGAAAGNGGRVGRRQSENANVVKEFLIGYARSFGNHNIDIVLNAMDQKYTWNNIDQSGNNTGILSFDQRRISDGLTPADKSSFYERNRFGLQGYMARLSYNFNSKYYIDATVRRDGSSRFGPGYKWGTFPAVGAAWRISGENFMSGTAGWLDDLKLRVGWGKSGNQETRDFAFLSLVNSQPKYAVGTSATGHGNIVNAAILGDFPIADMSWETVTSQNIAFDAQLMKSKFSVTLEYYNRLTEGILQAIEIPKAIGALNNPVVNLATVENKGIEIQLGYNDKIGDIGIHANLNLTTVNNDVTKLYRNKPQDAGNFQRIEVGQSLNYIYGYKVDGIFQTQEEVDAWLLAHDDPGNETQIAPGDIYFRDINGPALESDGADAYMNPNPDSVVNVFDQTYLGKTIAGHYYGLGIGLDYKGFDFSVNFRGTGDVQRVNYIKWSGESMSNGGVNSLATVSGRWTPTNPSTSMPRAISGDPHSNNRFSDRWVEDAGFFRLQNIQLGYSFSGSSPVIEKIKASNLRLYVSASNLFVISPYSGLDPENDTTPTTLMFGLNLGF
jgi:TonB-linked SusC/RagA family outer membrane protein